MCVRACVRACVLGCVRACVRACVRVCVCARVCWGQVRRSYEPISGVCALLRACVCVRACVRVHVRVCVCVCQVRHSYEPISPEEYDAAAAHHPACCPLFAMGDRRSGRQVPLIRRLGYPSHRSES